MNEIKKWVKIMNRKGFTLIELLATLVILGIVSTIVLISVTGTLNGTKDKTEEVFIKTIRDAMDIYTDSDGRKLTYGTKAVCTLKKTHGSVKLYKSNNITMKTVINSEYKPLTKKDLVNPKDNKQCSENASVSIYRDDDYVYYYKVSRAGLNCLSTDGGDITNLPEGCLG